MFTAVNYSQEAASPLSAFSVTIYNDGIFFNARLFCAQRCGLLAKRKPAYSQLPTLPFITMRFLSIGTAIYAWSAIIYRKVLSGRLDIQRGTPFSWAFPALPEKRQKCRTGGGLCGLRAIHSAEAEGDDQERSAGMLASGWAWTGRPLPTGPRDGYRSRRHRAATRGRP